MQEMPPTREIKKNPIKITSEDFEILTDGKRTVKNEKNPNDGDDEKLLIIMKKYGIGFDEGDILVIVGDKKYSFCTSREDFGTSVETE
jgi:hypothetical protein